MCKFDVCVVMFELLEFSESEGRTRPGVAAHISLHNRSRQARGSRHGGARERKREKSSREVQCVPRARDGRREERQRRSFRTLRRKGK